MRIGASLFLIAVGAILKFAVTKQVNGINLQTVGVVLMVVGLIGLALTGIFMTMRRRTDVVVRGNGPAYAEPPMYGTRATYVEQPVVDPIDPADPRRY